MGFSGIDRSLLPTAAAAPAAPPLGGADGVGTGQLKRRRREAASKTAHTALAPSAREASAPVKLDESFYRKCRWSLTLYRGGEKTLSRMLLRTLFSDEILQQIVERWNEGVSPLPNFTHKELWQLFTDLGDRLTPSLKHLREEAGHVMCRPIASRTIDPSDEELEYIFSGQPVFVNPQSGTMLVATRKSPLVAKKMDLNRLPYDLSTSVMTFVGYIQPLAYVNKQWNYRVNRGISSLVQPIIEHIDWLQDWLKSPLPYRTQFVVNDLFMQTIRELIGHFTDDSREVFKRMDLKIHRLTSGEQGYVTGLSCNVMRRPESIKSLIKRIPQLLPTTPDSIKEDAGFIEELIRISGMNLQYVPDKFRSDPKFVKLALEQEPIAYQFVLGTARSDEATIKYVFDRNGSMLRHAPEDIRSNPVYIKMAICSRCPTPEGRGLAVLPYALIENVWNNPEILDCVVVHNKDGESVLNHPLLPPALKSDRDFNFKAIINNIEKELKYIDLGLRENFEFLKAIMMKNSMQFFHISEMTLDDDLDFKLSDDMQEQFLLDKEFILQLFQDDKYESDDQLEFLLKHFKSDPDVMLAAVRSSIDGRSLKLATHDLFENLIFIKKVVFNKGKALQHIPLYYLLKYPVEVFISALENDGAAIEWVPHEILKDHPEFYAYGLKTNSPLWRWYPDSLKEEHISNAKAAIKKDYRVFEFFPPKFQEMAEFVEIAVKKEPKMIRYATSDWREDPDKFEQALRWNPLVFEFGSPRFKSMYHFNKLAMIHEAFNRIYHCGNRCFPFHLYLLIADSYQGNRELLWGTDLHIERSTPTGIEIIKLGLTKNLKPREALVPAEPKEEKGERR